MKIIVGKNAGFCYGVKRAVEGAKKELEDSRKSIYCLGEIVHNKDVVESLEKQGMKFIEDISETGGTTIIRAHGIPKEVYQKAKDLNIEIKDYTCPKVLNIHEIAEEYAKKGFYIILTGSKKHPENIGTISFCGEKYFVVENEDMIKEALDDFNKTGINKLLLISQTTFSVEKFERIQEQIKNEVSKDIEFVIKNTICSATRIRQEEVRELSKNVNKMIIIGGKNSSNTKKLYDIAKEFCNDTISIENKKDLDLDFFTRSRYSWNYGWSINPTREYR